jgi:hypothetical protein|tara:strand:- start:3567 stop:4049 length:483 start_codon:yes stop_codon:yes gene_type:complete
MSSLAEIIPIELVNHILSFRPRHPVAELICQFKKSYLNENCRYYNMPIGGFHYYYHYKQTFKELNDSWRMLKNTIFSKCLRENTIYKIKTKKYKNSEYVYGKKYYTDKKAIEQFDKESYYWGDIYKIKLVNIDIDSLEERTIQRNGNHYDSDINEQESDN